MRRTRGTRRVTFKVEETKVLRVWGVLLEALALKLNAAENSLARRFKEHPTSHSLVCQSLETSTVD